jgi:hypothetical protein
LSYSIFAHNWQWPRVTTLVVKLNLWGSDAHPINAWVWEDHPNGSQKDPGPRKTFAKIHSATKSRTLFFYPSIARCSPVENRQLEKLDRTRSAPSFNSCACAVDLSKRHWKSAPPCSHAILIADFILSAKTMNLDGLRSSWVRKLTM